MLKKLILLYFIIQSSAYANEAAYYKVAVFMAALHDLPQATHLNIIQGPMVRMVTYTHYPDYQPGKTNLSASIWTTVDPEVKKRCQHFKKSHQPTHHQLALWLSQLLGLPAEAADSRRFVVLNVPVIQAYYGSHPQHVGIFRPCTDPRINVAICTSTITDDNNIDSGFKNWFINTSISAHNLKTGMPWTEKGYTYNWNHEAKTILGVAEFIVLNKTPVEVLADPSNPQSAYLSPESYCS